MPYGSIKFGKGPIMTAMYILFWVFAGLIVYTYIGYPVSAMVVGKLRERTIKKAPYTPTLSIVIPAYNEEGQIRETLTNKLQLDYPKDKLEIIAVSDGSTDRTDDIVKEYLSHGVRLIRQEPRQGKTAALNRALAVAKGEIIVFSDANSLYEKEVLRHLTANFADKNVGYVTGRLVFGSPDANIIGDGSTAYMKYENFLRSLETTMGSIVGVNGGIDAVRKYLCTPMRPDQQSDFVLPLKVIEQGYRVVFEPDAVLKEIALNRPMDEYKMRVRVALRALNALKDMKQLLNPLRYGIIAWQLASHKILRYGAFIPLIGLLVTNLFLLDRGVIYQLVLAAQLVFYTTAFLGWVFERKIQRSRVLYAVVYFCLLNVASFHAFWKMMRGETQAVWKPRTG
jgi:cellulose synthase/poly-beta-1,6-N-acetylglucosamine synthase-like glycosyltransferase